MAGFSIVLLVLLFCWPAVLLYAAVMLVVAAAAEFVTSPAFPVLLASCACGAVAFVDALRVVWNHYRSGTLGQMALSELTRAAVLAVLAFVLFAVMCVMAGGMVLEWYRSLG